MSAPDTKFRILAVDDSEDILALLEVILGKEYEVKSAIDARTALRLAFEKPRPDLMLLDVEMPGTSGYDLCRALKASPALADIPVIFITAYGDAKVRIQAMREGAVEFLAKPFDHHLLLKRVRAALDM